MRSLLTIVFLTYCAGCQQLPEPARVPAAARTKPSAAAEIYEIDSDQSELTMLIYRAGPLANFGHNHVIRAGELSGRIYMQPGLEESEFELRLPVRLLIVDDPDDRAAAGPEFSSAPSATDRDGTRDNMLGSQLLDAANYPEVVVTGKFEESTATPRVELTIRIKDYAATKTVPVTLSLQDGTVRVSGDFELTHEELGLSPFSTMMGALRVSEEIRFRIVVTARRPAGSES